jgi:hypothetical protein
VPHDSNWAGNLGSQNPQLREDDFKRQGMSDTQAQEAAAAARRQQEERQRQGG